jgi:hypothetical protein
MASGVKSDVNWQQIMDEYVIGNDSVTYQFLADQHGVKADAVRQQAARYKWSLKRAEYRHSVSQSITKEAHDRQLLRTMEELDSQDLTILETGIVKALEALKGGDIPLTFQSLLNAMKDRRKIYETVYGTERRPDKVVENQHTVKVDNDNGGLIEYIRGLQTGGDMGDEEDPAE